MKVIEVFQKVNEQGVKLVRPRKGTPGEYDIKDNEGKKRGWVYVDGYTASAVIGVYNQLSTEAKKKMEGLTLTKIVDITWKLVKKSR